MGKYKYLPHALNEKQNVTPKYVRLEWTNLKGDIDKSITIMGSKSVHFPLSDWQNKERVMTHKLSPTIQEPSYRETKIHPT
jgi:hypothetical protein